jgi:hypothetical protein
VVGAAVGVCIAHTLKLRPKSNKSSSLSKDQCGGLLGQGLIVQEAQAFSAGFLARSKVSFPILSQGMVSPLEAVAIYIVFRFVGCIVTDVPHAKIS